MVAGQHSWHNLRQVADSRASRKASTQTGSCAMALALFAYFAYRASHENAARYALCYLNLWRKQRQAEAGKKIQQENRKRKQIKTRAKQQQQKRTGNTNIQRAK